MRRGEFPTRKRALGALALGAIALLSACSRSSSSQRESDDAGAAGGNVANACKSDLTARDLVGILGARNITVRDVPGNVEACSFNARSARVVITLRGGDEVEPFWKLTVSRNHGRMIAMTGVGNTALQLSDGSEVLARKADLSCQADATGIDSPHAQPAIKISGTVLARALGDLCNRVFAVH
jgi:hypothetical protein